MSVAKYIQVVDASGNTRLALLSEITNSSTSAPAVTDDEDDGYQAGNLWCKTDTGALYMCTDATAGAAVWELLIDGGGAVLKSDFDANSILAANVADTPLALSVATNSILGRQAGNIDDIAVAAQSLLLRGAADIVDQAIADSEFVGRPSGGNLGAVTAAQARAIIGAATEAEFDALAAAGVVDGDRIKDGAFTSIIVGGKFGAGVIPHVKLQNKGEVAMGSGAGQTITAAQLVDSGIIVYAAVDGGGISTATDTAAAIITQLGAGAAAGTSFEFVVQNLDAADAVTLTGGVGVTLSGSMTVAATLSSRFTCLVTGAGTVTIYRG